MRLRFLLVAVLPAALAAVGGAAAARVRVQAVAHHCRGETNAVGISVTALSCSRAASAILTYEGAPLGCTTGPWCVQSGSDTRGTVLFVDCARVRLRVSCQVYVHNRRGNALDPRLHGIRLSGRYHRGTVRFTMRHDPYGCPRNPICRRPRAAL